MSNDDVKSEGAPAQLAPDSEADAPKAPARRRRTARPAEAAEAAPEGGAAAGDDAPAARPRRRLASQADASGEGAAQAAPVETAPAVAPSAAAAPEAQGVPPDAAPAAQDGGDSGAPAGEASFGEGGESGERGARGRRRGRRDRRRGPRDENGERLVREGEAAAPTRPPADAGEVFADVLSGGYDAAAEAAADDAEAAPTGEADAQAAPAKRVLPPEPDAPKLHKVLAQAGVGSRRDMEELIAGGRITVNGEPAHTGQRISFGDRVQVDGKPIKFRIAPPPPRIVAYHKPVGEVVTMDDPQQRPTVFRNLPRLAQGKWQSVGRLDINTEGLLLFTNSGELANQLMHPRFGVEREYAVRVLGTLVEEQREELLEGVDIDGHEASFKSITDGGGDGANHWYRVVITEGRNREVRRLFEAVGLTVNRLIRIRYGNVVLPRGLRRGAFVDLDDADVRAIRRLASGGGNDARGGAAGRGGRPERPPQRERERERDRDADDDHDHDIGPIPNPLEQTFDRRFAQGGRRGIGTGFGNPNRPGGEGSGGGGGAPQRKKGEPRQPDPLQTSVGYIGADAFHRKGSRGGRSGGGGGGGGNRGGGGGGGGGFGGGRRGR
jgi:23S rRNA pseudouridine2605 synthase